MSSPSNTEIQPKQKRNRAQANNAQYLPQGSLTIIPTVSSSNSSSVLEDSIASSSSQSLDQRSNSAPIDQDIFASPQKVDQAKRFKVSDFQSLPRKEEMLPVTFRTNEETVNTYIIVQITGNVHTYGNSSNSVSASPIKPSFGNRIDFGSGSGSGSNSSNTSGKTRCFQIVLEVNVKDFKLVKRTVIVALSPALQEKMKSLVPGTVYSLTDVGKKSSDDKFNAPYSSAAAGYYLQLNNLTQITQVEANLSDKIFQSREINQLINITSTLTSIQNLGNEPKTVDLIGIVHSKERTVSVSSGKNFQVWSILLIDRSEHYVQVVFYSTVYDPMAIPEGSILYLAGVKIEPKGFEDRLQIKVSALSVVATLNTTSIYNKNIIPADLFQALCSLSNNRMNFKVDEASPCNKSSSTLTDINIFSQGNGRGTCVTRLKIINVGERDTSFVYKACSQEIIPFQRICCSAGNISNNEASVGTASQFVCNKGHRSDEFIIRYKFGIQVQSALPGASHEQNVATFTLMVFHEQALKLLKLNAEETLTNFSAFQNQVASIRGKHFIARIGRTETNDLQVGNFIQIDADE